MRIKRGQEVRIDPTKVDNNGAYVLELFEARAKKAGIPLRLSFQWRSRESRTMGRYEVDIPSRKPGVSVYVTEIIPKGVSMYSNGYHINCNALVPMFSTLQKQMDAILENSGTL